MSVVKRLYYFFEKNVCPARENPVWSQYMRRPSASMRSDIGEDYLTLLLSCRQYRDLLQTYNIGERRNTLKEVESVAKRVGLAMPETHKAQNRK